MASTSGISASTNFDIDAIVSSLMTVEQKPLTLLSQQKTSYQSKISAYATLQSSLSSFQTALANLSSSSKFKAQAATSSDSSVFTATSDGNATVGNYAIKVGQLAQSHKVATSSFSSTSAAVGTGTITIALGTYNDGDNTFTPNPDKTATSITITAANNSLAGIRDAINAGDMGVTAAIVNDGQNGGGRLVLTSKESGEANSIKVTVSDGDGDDADGSGLSSLTYDPTAATGAGKNLVELQEARNAKLNIDGIDVESASNVVTGVLSGITLNLFKASPDTSVSLEVTRDVNAIKTAVNSFVTAFNAVNTTLRNLTKFDDSTTTAADRKNGALLGDATARSISSQIKMALTKSVGGTDAFSTLSQIGVSLQRDGSLALDSTKLEKAIETNLDDVAKLFAAVGTASDAETRFVTQGSKTQSGTYAINITQAATRGTLTGSAGPDLDIVAGVNDTLSIKIGSASYNLTLSAGIYASVEDLAQELRTQLGNAKSSAEVAVEDGMLKIISANYGSNSVLEVAGGTAASSLFGSNPLAVAGLDVAGTINGAEATGNGQVLTSTASGNPAEGLVVSIGGSAIGDRGSVSLSVGYAAQLNNLVKGFVSDTGLLASRTDGLQDSIKRVTQQEDALQIRLTAIEARYRSQFVALDVLMTQMQSTQSYLTQQLAALSSLNNR
ncbi:flagellar filament capping protein FliD [Methylobacillus arboreus]|uniref:flagellar filament capping protein FliD n=1 Tax=Methylobacillus arboreus TaxID=755170 RepID=UPI001E335850|nr:flagellar filament capping protein FliD [Methylobacillus arboreus]MCB5189256.1 flagellar filament capping protein FliD [Methylobacillus arboreus]